MLLQLYTSVPVVLSTLIYISTVVKLALHRTTMMGHSQLDKTAEWNMLKIALIIFGLYGAQLAVMFLAGPPSEHPMSIIVVLWLLHVSVCGLNPFIYLATSSEIHAVVPHPKISCTALTARTSLVVPI